MAKAVRFLFLLKINSAFRDFFGNWESQNYLLQLIRQDLKNFPADRIGFVEIGRKSSAHLKAYQGYKSKRVDKRIKAEQILRIIARLK